MPTNEQNEDYLRCPSCRFLSADGSKCENPWVEDAKREEAIKFTVGHDCNGWRGKDAKR